MVFYQVRTKLEFYVSDLDSDWRKKIRHIVMVVCLLLLFFGMKVCRPTYGDVGGSEVEDEDGEFGEGFGVED